MCELIQGNGGVMAGEHRRIRKEARPSATSSTARPKWTALTLRQALRADSPATNSRALSLDLMRQNPIDIAATT